MGDLVTPTIRNTLLVIFTHISSPGRELKVYAPASQQPALNRPTSDLQPGESYILKCLTNPAYLDKFFELIIIEDGISRAKKFNVKNFTFYRVTNYFTFFDYLLSLLTTHCHQLLTPTNYSLPISVCSVTMEMKYSRQ